MKEGRPRASAASRIRTVGHSSAADAATITVRVVPRAGRTGVAGKRGDAWLVRLAAAPVDGAANDTLIAYVAGLLRCPRRDVSIVSGERSRDKLLRVVGMTLEEVDRCFSAPSP